MVYCHVGDAQTLGLGGRPLITAVGHQGTRPRCRPDFRYSPTRSSSRARSTPWPAAMSSINNTKILMWLIAGIIIAALLYVSALQRVRDFAVLKALGSSTVTLLPAWRCRRSWWPCRRRLRRHHLQLHGRDLPTAGRHSHQCFVTLPIVAIIVGLLSSLVALRQATSADPAAAFG